VISSLAVEHDVHILVLAECNIASDVLIDTLGKCGLESFTFPYSPEGDSSDLKVFTRFKKSHVKWVFSDPNDHITIRRLTLPNTAGMLLVALHTQSKLEWPANQQAQIATRLGGYIRNAEEKKQVDRTIVVGDLNMNPFEDGVVSSEGFHATMSKGVAKGFRRKVHGVFRKLWKFFDERPNSAQGTFYYESSGLPISHYWYVLDQVMVRAPLIDNLVDVKILDTVLGTPLYDNDGIPDETVGSDHFPLAFALDL
jgi:exonuclease III